MGKSSKKSASKVDSAPPVSATPTKQLKKGKREAEELIEKEVSVKKQKKGVIEETMKKKTEVKKTKVEETSSSEDTSSDSVEELKKPSKAVQLPKNQQLPGKKNGPAEKGKLSRSSDDSESDEDEIDKSKSIGAAKNGLAAGQKKNESSESDSEDEGSDSDQDADVTKKLPALAKNGADTTAKKNDDSDSEDESSTSGDEKAPAMAAKNGPPAAIKKSDDSESEEESSSSDDDVPAAKLPVAAVAKGGPGSIKRNESSDDSDSDDETSGSDDDAPPPKTVPPKRPSFAAESKKDKEESSEDDSSDEESEGEEPQKKKSKVEPTAIAKVVKPKAGKEESSSEEESSDDETPKAKVVKKKSSSDDSSSEDEEESSEEEEEPSKTPLKKDTDVEMVDTLQEKGGFSTEKTPKTPATPQSQASGSKTLFVGNLSYSIEQADVENFFKNCGELVDVRFATHPDGAFKGYGHVEFATAEAAQKALKELNGQDLLGRAVRLDLAVERGSYTPQSGNERNSFQRGFGSQGRTTIFVRGVGTDVDEYELKDALREHFQSCGDITRISVPKGDNGLKGFAYIDFASSDSLDKALEFDNSNLNDYTIQVEEAKPKGDNPGGGRDGRSGGRGRGRDGSRGRGRDGGRFNGRGRFNGSGDRGGRFSRGRGNFNKPSMATAGTGKKTTFDD